jgi:hypothetical protein
LPYALAAPSGRRPTGGADHHSRHNGPTVPASSNHRPAATPRRTPTPPAIDIQRNRSTSPEQHGVPGSYLRRRFVAHRGPRTLDRGRVREQARAWSTDLVPFSGQEGRGHDIGDQPPDPHRRRDGGHRPTQPSRAGTHGPRGHHPSLRRHPRPSMRSPERSQRGRRYPARRGSRSPPRSRSASACPCSSTMTPSSPRWPSGPGAWPRRARLLRCQASDGIGGGFILNGTIDRGGHGMAGEIGLVTLCSSTLTRQLVASSAFPPHPTPTCVPRESRTRRRPVPGPVSIASPSASGCTVARTRSPSRP